MATFPLLYFPPISYFLDWKLSKEIFIERHENYQKQSFRNRMTILSSNGRTNLSIPILRNNNRLYKDSKINFEYHWQKNHWKTIEFSYRNSPYFEYYENIIYNLIYQKKNIYLILILQYLIV